jgi:uncharacterized membrane protein
MNRAAILAVIIYLVVDITYVFLSKDFYQSVVKDIQGRYSEPRSSVLVAALLSYSCMALGFLVLVVPLVTKRIQDGMSVLRAALPIGLTFGLVMYGVFNFTLHAMFDNYTLHVILRDLVWGVTWATTSTIIYAALLKFT